jgi:hypothetical protein
MSSEDEDERSPDQRAYTDEEWKAMGRPTRKKEGEVIEVEFDSKKDSIVEVTFEQRKLVEDPPLRYWAISVETSTSMWRETFGSEAEAKAFERGVLAIQAAVGWGKVSVSVMWVHDPR